MGKWLSRKFLVMVITAILTPILVKAGVPADTIHWLLGMVAIWLGGQSVVDSAAAFNGTPAAAVIAKSGTVSEVVEAAKDTPKVK